jgi:hypothetical protein
MMKEYLRQVLFPKLKYGVEKDVRFNVHVGTEMMRMNFRFYNQTINKDKKTFEIFPVKINIQSLSHNGKVNIEKYQEIDTNFVTKIVKKNNLIFKLL